MERADGTPGIYRRRGGCTVSHESGPDEPCALSTEYLPVWSDLADSLLMRSNLACVAMSPVLPTGSNGLAG